MDKDKDLFEAFNDSDGDDNKKLKQSSSTLGHKRERSIEGNPNGEHNEDNTSEKPQKKHKKVEVKDEDEDTLLTKTVFKILNDDNSNQDDSIDPLNMGMIVDTFQFPGGVHENIRENDYQGQFILEKDSTKPPATRYPFKLDHFQERAILCLENHQSVLVSAHTSAGKTVVAQYAIAMALRDKQRVIYTSPIKALSNQKYRELASQYQDVGLMTGDVTLNPTASCIVMTTEILRNMLYKGSEITREMAWVIFDEVHYLRDKERGVVWEETIILLSNKINYVFLSATIPNAREFAMWICKLKNQPCNVVYTDYRPVPLQHYVYPSGSDGIYLVVDANGNFRQDNFNKALEKISESLNIDQIIHKTKDTRNNKDSDIKKLVSLISEQQLDPAIVFSFSKKECEDHALSLAKTDLTNDSEQKLIETIFLNAVSTLAEEDQNLPQIQLLLPLLKKGIGIHHGGMLPILKECVELIFQEGLIKVLFSTETFSMGINMPAKTVVFTSAEKWDGEQHRFLTGGEYIQMSGRAGRRGIDDKGIIIMMLNKKMDHEMCRNILSGQADSLKSSFHLNYNQLVNLYRLEGMECEYIVKRSFRQFQAERSVPLMKRELKELHNQFIQYASSKHKQSLIESYVNISEQIKQYKEEIRQIVVQPRNIVPFICPGRLVKILNWGYGIVVNISLKNLETIYAEKNRNLNEEIKSELGENNDEFYIVDTLVYIKKSLDANNTLAPGSIKERNGMMGVVPFLLKSFENISPMKVFLPKNLKEQSSMNLAEKMYFEIMKNESKILLMDPIEHLEINDQSLIENTHKITSLQSKQSELEKESQSLYGENISLGEIDTFKAKLALKFRIKELIKSLYSIKKLVLQEELGSMKRVLRRLEFVKDDIVSIKGQIACNISSGDEVLITEMLFNGILNSLEPEELAALLSCFLASEGASGKNKEEDRLMIEKYKRLSELHKVIEENAERVADVMVDCKIKMDKKEYQRGFKADYMIPILEWTQGKSFGDLSQKSEIFEGSLIRNIRRLDEFIKQICDSARQIGNFNLKNKLDEASKLIKRGIPFAASLYLTN